MELIANSNEWLEYRRQRIGASDIPIILGVSEFCTPYELYLRKIGKRNNDKPNFATELGHQYEPAIRAHLEMKLGRDFPPKTVEHKEHSFLIANLDGWNDESKETAEFKFAGKDVFSAAARGFVHEKYWPQVQTQLMISEGVGCHFYVAKGDFSKARKGIQDLAHVYAPPDKQYQSEVLTRILEFRKAVMEQQPPAISKKDVLYADDERSMVLFSELKKALKQLQKAEKTTAGVVEMLLKAQESYTQAFKACEAHCEHVLKWHAVEAAGVKLVKNKKGVATVEEII